jgi:hypothetical protein
MEREVVIVPRTQTDTGVSLKTYILFVYDDRYTVPSLDTVIVRDDGRAIELAQQRLRSSPHYGGIEVWEDDRLVFRGGRAEPGPAND